MIRQTHSAPREEIVARALAPVVAELRLVDAADFIAFVRLDQTAALADILAGAAELYLMPGALRLGSGSEAEAFWGEAPRISLSLEFWLSGVTVFFRLVMDAERAGVDVAYAAFADRQADEEANTAFLRRALEDVRILRTEPVP